MNILYYYWNENSKDDCVESLKRLGHNVTVWSRESASLSDDSVFAEALRTELRSHPYDCIFSFDYFPLLSNGALEAGLPYISWIYDCPHYTLESETLSNPCNRVFIFDYAMSEMYRSQGIDTVDYMPLPVNTLRLNRLLGNPDNISKTDYKHDISFIGSLYNDEHNYYDRITYLPDYLKGYLDAIIKAQGMLYGMDLASQMMTPDVCGKLGEYVKVGLGSGFRDAQNNILRDMIRKKVTVNDRDDLLTILGNSFSVDLYSGSTPPDHMHVKHFGTTDYLNGMPEIFASSKININITLRSILTGIPLRVVDILGAGGFCLTNYQAEMAEYFENGRELVWFESPEDMLDKAEYYLSHDEERIRIAQNGHAAAENLFSYDVLLPKIFMNC